MLGICGGDASPVIIPQLSPETSNIYANEFLETISRRRARQRDMLTDDGFVVAFLSHLAQKGCGGNTGSERSIVKHVCAGFSCGHRQHPQKTLREHG